jgi:hypothetical protein
MHEHMHDVIASERFKNLQLQVKLYWQVNIMQGSSLYWQVNTMQGRGARYHGSSLLK